MLSKFLLLFSFRLTVRDLDMADLFGGQLFTELPLRGLRAIPIETNIGGMRTRFLQRAAALNGALGFRYQRANGDNFTDAVQVLLCRHVDL